MSPKPTREEVLDIIATVNREGVEGLTRTEVRDLGGAYLAQEEELKESRGHIMEMGKQLGILKTENQALKRKGELLCCQCGVLEMENQELKASMEADYIERQAKHIQKLVKENQALKAEREKDIQDAINEYRGDLRC